MSVFSLAAADGDRIPPGSQGDWAVASEARPNRRIEPGLNELLDAVVSSSDKFYVLSRKVDRVRFIPLSVSVSARSTASGAPDTVCTRFSNARTECCASASLRMRPMWSPDSAYTTARLFRYSMMFALQNCSSSSIVSNHGVMGSPKQGWPRA
jgi:hypothetical protein